MEALTCVVFSRKPRSARPGNRCCYDATDDDFNSFNVLMAGVGSYGRRRDIEWVGLDNVFTTGTFILMYSKLKGSNHSNNQLRSSYLLIGMKSNRTVKTLDFSTLNKR
jgi:hypothetical protein